MTKKEKTGLDEVFVDLKPKPKEYFDIIKSNLTFKDVGGLEEVKEELRLKIIYPFENAELFKQYGKKAGGGLLFYGPPGCGKTFIAKACAGEIKFNFINVSISDIKDMWHGISEKNISSLFKFTRNNAPAVLFIDEVDALCSSRNNKIQHEFNITQQFLLEMDGIQSNNENILVIGATNAPWAMDHAFLRQGRFDKYIFVPPPDFKSRKEILQLLLKDKPAESIDYNKISSLTNGFSGADLKNLVETTVDGLIKKCLIDKRKEPIKIKTEFIIDAIAKIVPSAKRWFQEVNNYLEFANDDGFYDPVKKYLDKPDDGKPNYFG